MMQWVGILFYFEYEHFHHGQVQATSMTSSKTRVVSTVGSHGLGWAVSTTNFLSISAKCLGTFSVGSLEILVPSYFLRASRNHKCFFLG